MSEDIRNAQYIQIPESGAVYKFLNILWRQYAPMVDKITDSNGNIIWGRPSKYLYRKLEYIYFDGVDEYIESPIGTKNTYYRSFTFTLARNNVRQMPLGLYDGTSSSTNNRRYYAMDIQASGNTNGARFCLGNTYSSVYATATYFPINTKRTITLRNYLNSSNQNAMECKILNESGSQLASQTITATTDSLPTSKPYFMATHTIQSGGTNIVENPTKGNLYHFEERQTNASGALLSDYIPCQRKSDNVCGMYDTMTNTFLPMVGTTITDAAAGPTVEEY